MPLTAEARERMEHTLSTSDHRSVTVRREDLREALSDASVGGSLGSALIVFLLALLVVAAAVAAGYLLHS